MKKELAINPHLKVRMLLLKAFLILLTTSSVFRLPVASATLQQDFFTKSLKERNFEDLSLGYENQTSVNTPTNPAGDYNRIKLDYDRYFRSRNSYIYTDISLRYYPKGQDVAPAVSSLYLKIYSDKMEISIGRKVLDWLDHEKYWGTNFLNSGKGRGPLDLGQEGIPGLSVSIYRYKKFKFGLFTSFLYIPQLYPKIENPNQSITGVDTWLEVPPTETVIENKALPIRYNVNYPQIKDVVFQRGLGTNLEYFWNSGVASLMFMYRPENLLRINADAYTSEDLDFVEVNANPIVNHHAILSFNVKQEIGGYGNLTGALDVVDPNASLGKDAKKVYLSDLKENDRIYETEYFNVSPSYERISYLHLAWDKLFNSSYYRLGYIHLLSQNDYAGDDFYSSPVKWRSAVNLYHESLLTDKVPFLVDLKYDFINQDLLIKSGVQYKIFKNFSAGVTVEFLKAPKNESYWSRMRTNDSVYSDITFLF
jgi:hypothetical protein